ncbi:hypothetical protein [Proteiniphilum sp. X52]|uniref:hypothetical protein n=1 Tax=Proteiniphilum sp. X52 TaxID=2382159 RepID=UPI001313DE98|nr:hypothetical protein [Proteiniphilum sp. X52]
MQEKFSISKPVVIADSGLLSNDNLKALEDEGYECILINLLMLKISRKTRG